jgi:hypothetical protein
MTTNAHRIPVVLRSQIGWVSSHCELGQSRVCVAVGSSSMSTHLHTSLSTRVAAAPGTSVLRVLGTQRPPLPTLRIVGG